MLLLIEEIDGGFRITDPAKRWTWWVYPSDLEIRNNGERYKLTGQRKVIARMAGKGNIHQRR